MQIIILLIALVLCLFVQNEARSKLFKDVKFGSSPVDAVNTLGGTDSRYDLSRGSTLPLITRPWGFNAFAPQTDDDPTWPGWWFHPSDRRYFGLRLTHQPSPWISDYGNFLIKAYMPSNPSSQNAAGDDFAAYSPAQSTFSPYYFATSLFNYGNSNGNLQIEFTPSMHGGILRAKFPAYVAHENGDSDTAALSQLRRLSIVLPQSSDLTEVGKSPLDGTVMISGHTTKNSGGVGGKEAAYGHYFVAAIYRGDGTHLTSLDSVTVKAGTNLAWVDFNPNESENDVLIMRLATSFISKEQALLNLQHEVDVPVSFEALKDNARDEWNSVLGRIEVSEPPAGGITEQQSGDLYSVFYSSLYRASLFPRQLTEFDPEGNPIHWSPFATSSSTRVETGPLSTDSGFWDAWNTVYPLLTLFHRPQLAVTMQGWLTAFSEGGWLPKWASPGYRSGMIGTMGDVSIADAIVKDIPGFDVKQAYTAIRKDAFESPPVGVEGVGRVCLSSYLTHGYVPRDAPMTTGGTCYEVVSRTLNYLQADHAVAQAAQKLGQTDDYAILSQRAGNFSLLFDETTGFFRSKALSSGKWNEPFDQFGWGNDYTESGPWQYRFYLPYDAVGLNQLYATHGNRDMCALLKETMTSQGLFHLGGYSSIIHEQTEMTDHCFGQYAHNNQPVHHMLYMHFFNGYASECATQGRHYIRQTLTQLYRADADMFPGDEDNGEMGAWFVLSAIGLYERAPGSTDFEFGIPLFSHVKIDISDVFHAHGQRFADVRKFSDAVNNNLSKEKANSKKVLEIIAHNNAMSNTRVEKIRWNGVDVPSISNGISYAKLAQGGTLEFFMAPPTN